MSFEVLVPVRGLKSSKKKLRKELGDDIVTTVVEQLVDNTLSILSKSKLQSVVLTADETLINSGKYHEIKYIYDDGTSLNLAISKAVNKLESTKIMLVMADLPGLTVDVIKKIIYLSEKFNYVIAPTSDGGTAIAVLPSKLMGSMLFGKNSAEKIIKAADEMHIGLYTLITPTLSHDLDDLGDWNYWQEQKYQFNLK